MSAKRRDPKPASAREAEQRTGRKATLADQFAAAEAILAEVRASLYRIEVMLKLPYYAIQREAVTRRPARRMGQHSGRRPDGL
jgi:hypothetical protein